MLDEELDQKILDKIIKKCKQYTEILGFECDEDTLKIGIDWPRSDNSTKDILNTYNTLKAIFDYTIIDVDTFGTIPELHEYSKTHYGFLYRIDLVHTTDFRKYNYIGQKSFNRGTDWRCYKGSSQYVFEKISQGYIPNLTVLDVFLNEDLLLMAEMNKILAQWNISKKQSLNYAIQFPNGHIIKKRHM